MSLLQCPGQTSKRVPNQLRACCSVTIAVTAPTLQEFAINPSSSTIIKRLSFLFILLFSVYTILFQSGPTRSKGR